MYRIKLLFFAVMISISILSVSVYSAEDGLPPKLQAILLARVLLFYTNSSLQMNVYVVGSGQVVDEIKELIGKSKIKNVSFGDTLPETKPDIIYLADATKFDIVNNYAKKNRILSITSVPTLVSKGISLGFGVFNDKPQILLNEKSSLEEHVTWNPELLKSATLVK